MSVVIPTHNTGRYIVSAVQSVLDQTYRDFEIIVVDDASTDGTEQLLEPLSSNIHYIKQEHAGSAVARNRGLLHARGRYIAFLDADDLWLPTKLERQVALAEEHPEAVLVYCDFNKSDDLDAPSTSRLAQHSHRQVGSEFLSLLRQNFLHTSSVLIRRATLASTGLFDPKLINAQDWDFWIRLADAGSFAYVDEILTHYRVHNAQSVGTLKFARNVVYADQLVLARWSDDEDAVAQIELKLAQDLWVLGRREWRHGNFKAARAAYWRCASYPRRRWKAAGRALICLLPAPILRRMQRANPERARDVPVEKRHGV